MPSSLSVAATHVLHTDFLSISEFRHTVCFLDDSWDFPYGCFSPVENALHPQTPCVHVPNLPCTQSQRQTTSRYRMCFKRSSLAMLSMPNAVAVPQTTALNSGSPLDNAIIVCVDAAFITCFARYDAMPLLDLHTLQHPAWSEPTSNVTMSTGSCVTNLCTILGLPNKYRPHLFAITCEGCLVVGFPRPKRKSHRGLDLDLSLSAEVEGLEGELRSRGQDRRHPQDVHMHGWDDACKAWPQVRCTNVHNERRAVCSVLRVVHVHVSTVFLLFIALCSMMLLCVKLYASHLYVI